jgi:LAS superfamily LD-carboxypeptidase LdcB
VTSSAPRPIRIRLARIAALLVVAAVIVAALVDEWPAASSPNAASPLPALRAEHRRALGEADGAVPAGTTVFDDAVAGVARVDRPLLDAVRAAATDAAPGGVAFLVDSGWRSRAYQARLLQDAVARYGSPAEAARWVATPDTSAHVSGDAIDVGTAAATWLAEHGAAYGLCRVYGNEPWHFELRPEAIAGGCPPTYADPTHDPRVHP